MQEYLDTTGKRKAQRDHRKRLLLIVAHLDLALTLGIILFFVVRVNVHLRTGASVYTPFPYLHTRVKK